jgi:hypothetical protein
MENKRVRVPGGNAETRARRLRGNPSWTPERNRQRQLKHRYRMTVSQYEALLEAQGHRCALCGCHLGNLLPHIDHIKHTFIVRGILCPDCNKNKVGSLTQDFNLGRLIAYLLGLHGPIDTFDGPKFPLIWSRDGPMMVQWPSIRATGQPS